MIFDVENSSRAAHVSTVMDHLGLGAARSPEIRLMAVGNWGVVGQETAALLARQGAQLLHTAPAFGVKDWSDLWIAVMAGIWIGDSRPGDVLEIVTDDQAFDAVGDVAAGKGVIFRRLSFRGLVKTGEVAPPPTRAGRPRRRNRRSPAR